MYFFANEFQLKHIFGLVLEAGRIYGPRKAGKITKYGEISNISEIDWGYKRSVMSFKKLLFPNGKPLVSDHHNFAIFGMPPCDIAALKIFLKQFDGSGLTPHRDNILIIGGECTPDDNCFCNQYDLSANLDYDLFVKEDIKGQYLIEAKTWKGKELVEKAALKKSDKTFSIKPKSNAEKLDLDLARKNISDKNLTADYWTKIGNNCFGCGACSTVCPLCFCFHQDYQSCPDGSDNKCLHWDSCFADDFAKVQFGHDMRPKNSDRLYNWYHHKFVRGPKEVGDALCVGCGRCITACPAHLSIHNIIHSLNKKYPDDK